MDHEPDCLVKSSKSLWLQNSIITFLTFAFWQTRCFSITVSHFFYCVGLRLSFWFVVKQKPRLPAEMDVHGDTIPLKKKAVLSTSSRRYLVDGFPRSFDNLRGWEEVIGNTAWALEWGDWKGPGDWFQICERGDARGMCFFSFSKKRS